MSFKDPSSLKIKEYTIPFLDDRSDEMIVALVGDLHIGPITSEKQIGFLKTGLKKIKPDVILLQGDLIDSPEFLDEPKYFRKTKQVLKFLSELAPTVTVFGNHDLFISTRKNRTRSEKPIIPEGTFEKWEAIFKETGVKLLKDEWFTLGDLRVFGFFQDKVCFEKDGKTGENYQEMRKKLKKLAETGKLETKPGKFNWFFSHAPIHELVKMKELRGFEAFSFGHTHGGCVPRGVDAIVDKFGLHGGLIAPTKGFFPREQIRGMEILPNRARLIVTSGLSGVTATALKPLQYLNFLKSAEITKITIKGI